MAFEFIDGFIPKKTLCEPGAIARIAQEIDTMSAKRALLICDKGVYDHTNLVNRIKEILKEVCVGVFNGVRPHAITTTITEGKELCVERKADLLISLGGGSAHDTAKGIATLVAEGGDNILDYRVIFEFPDKMEIPVLRQPKLPIITITTTLAGAEVIGAAGYTDPETKLKKIVVDPKLTPRLVVYDPEVALTTPVEVFVSSGMNAFDHCVETIYSKKHQEISDTLAMKSIELLMDSLPKCVQNKDDISAREKALMASFLAALAYGNSWLGINHAICHCLGARYEVPHGIANAIMLPHGMRFNLEVTGDRQVLIAKAMGIETRDLTDLEAGATAADQVEQLNEKLGLPIRLRDVGVPEEGLALLAEDTMQDRQLLFNPKPVQNKEEVIEILKGAW